MGCEIILYVFLAMEPYGIWLRAIAFGFLSALKPLLMP
jgi:hypothetical protein